MGNYNDEVTEYSFLPDKKVAEESDNYLLTMRKPKYETTMYGMLTRLTYPTGGYTKFRYEQNRFSEDITKMTTTGIDTLAAGLRISDIIDYDSNNTKTTHRKFLYIHDDGTSSGLLLWRPIPYVCYISSSEGYYLIERSILSSSDEFPYSLKSHIEYIRVIEEQIMLSNNTKKAISEYIYYTASNNNCRDEIINYDSEFQSEIEVDEIWKYGMIKLHNELNIIKRYESYSQSRIGGKLQSLTQYANDLEHPINKCQYIYDYYSTSPSLPFYDVKCMHIGLLSTYRYSLETPYIRNIKEQQYNENGELIIEKVTDFNLDDNFRVSETKTTDSKGNILSNKYYYHPEVPAYLTEHICKRGDAVIEATKFYFKCNAGRVYLPSSCERGLISSESPSSPLTYRIDKTFDKYDSFGHPLQITDKDGKSTCFIWGYNGQYVIAKIENIKYEELSRHCSIAENPYPNYLPNPLESSLRALGDNIMVTTYQYKPLVGVQCITDASGRKIYYDYDKDGKLICVKDDKGSPVQSYQYNITTYDKN